MQARPFRTNPIALTGTYTTNLFNPGTTTGGTNATSAPYDKTQVLVRHIRVMNKTNGAATFRLYKGATGGNAAGTELAYDQSVSANSYVDLWFQPGDLYTTADFLVGGASAGTTLVLQLEGEITVGT